jgi:hypothetical protein
MILQLPSTAFEENLALWGLSMKCLICSVRGAGRMGEVGK